MCQHTNVRKSKIVKVGGDRFYQSFESCQNCLLQTNVRLTELKKGNHRDRNY